MNCKEELYNMKNNKAEVSDFIWVFIMIFMMASIAVLFLIFPIYHVWSSEMSGKAELREAEWNKQIAIEEAKAELESSTLKAEADIIRAEGIAESNRIISETLTSEYITWKWVEGLHDGSSEVIYVPTEANLPLLEARNK